MHSYKTAKSAASQWGDDVFTFLLRFNVRVALWVVFIIRERTMDGRTDRHWDGQLPFIVAVNMQGKVDGWISRKEVANMFSFLYRYKYDSTIVVVLLVHNYFRFFPLRSSSCYFLSASFGLVRSIEMQLIICGFFLLANDWNFMKLGVIQHSLFLMYSQS